MNTSLSVINESNEMEINESIECSVSLQTGRKRKCRKLERKITGLVRDNEENDVDEPSQSSRHAWLSNNRDKSSHNTYSKKDAHDNNQFQRNVRGDSVTWNTSDMLDKDDNPAKGERENNEVSNGRENVISIGERDQSVNDGQLMVIIIIYDDSNGDDFVVVLLFQ